MITASASQAGNPLTLAPLQRPHPLAKAILSCFFWGNQTHTAERNSLPNRFSSFLQHTSILPPVQHARGQDSTIQNCDTTL